MDYRNYITIDLNKRGGKPCVRGLRITVYEVLEYLASEMTEAEILADFPDLTREDLKACIAYAADRERPTLEPTYLVRKPEVKFDQEKLEFIAKHPGEQVSQILTVTNTVPETILQGTWSVAPHPSDRVHLI